MLISYSHKFIFVHVFKTAGTSVTSALEKISYRPRSWRISNLPTWLHTPWNQILRTRMHKHATALEIQAAISPKIFTTFFKFAFVRNPWDWQVSLYHYILNDPNNVGHEVTKQMGSFRNFIFSRAELNRTQSGFLMDNNGNLLVDFVGRVETIQEDFAKICKKIGFHAKLPLTNVSKHTHYRDYYDAETRDLTAKIYQEDIARFQYNF